MARLRALKVYLLILVIFNFFAGGFGISAQGDEFNLDKYRFITEIRSNLAENEDTFSSLLRIVLVPFILIDALIFLVAILGVGISVLPPAIELLLFAPLAIFVIFDYIIPMFRGN